ncbi:thioredoxin-like protein [Trametopsis cervina]|nr:thioredoxin-like protein [Trametopsis cervina]
MASKRVIKLLVISDVTCPWCYVGQREMERAIEMCSDLPVQVELEWRPYRIYPSLKDGQFLDKKEWYETRFSKDKLHQMQTMAGVRAAELGLDINMSDGVITQTTLAHRLILKAWKTGGQKMQQQVLWALFQVFFVKTENIGDTQVLANAAVEAGMMGKEEAVKFLESDECLDEVETLMQEARRKGVNGVPFVVIDGKWAVSGGQTSDVYAQIFKKLAATETSAPRPRAAPASAGVPVTA